MTSKGGTYLMILPVLYYRIDSQTVALESAFAKHLQQLREKVSTNFSRLIVAMVEMSAEEYEQGKKSLLTFNESEEQIFFETIYKSANYSRLSLLLRLLAISKRLRHLIKQSDLVHSGLSSNVWFPMEFIGIIHSIFLRKPTLFVVDIDYRNSAEMGYRTGELSRKSYLLCKYVYDRLRSLQIRVAVSKCSLVLLKGKKLCHDFGSGQPHVKNFLDAAHSEAFLIDANSLDRKLADLEDESRTLEVVYFGRLVSYKGIDRCIEAIAAAQHLSDRDIRFHIIGGGEQSEELKHLAERLGLGSSVIFHGLQPFDRSFFERLYSYHLLLAAPLREDTPRSALDAMAAGIPILAFDTYYYADLTSTGAVAVVPWLSVEQMARTIATYNQNRALLKEMAIKAVEFARENTQEEWLEKRYRWTQTYANLEP